MRRKIYVDIGPHALKRLYERLLIPFEERELIKKLNEGHNVGYFLESKKFAEVYHLNIPSLSCFLVLSSHVNRQRDHYFAKTIKKSPFPPEGKKVLVKWYIQCNA